MSCTSCNAHYSSSGVVLWYMYVHVYLVCSSLWCIHVYTCTCRWDLQRARALLEHQELLKKYNKKGGGSEPVAEKKKEKIVSFLPKLEDSKSLCTQGFINQTLRERRGLYSCVSRYVYTHTTPSTCWVSFLSMHRPGAVLDSRLVSGNFF